MAVPGIIFDLDGTSVDTVYQHVSAWYEALRTNGITAPQWRIHHAIGMSGNLFLPKLLRDQGRSYSQKLIARLESAHARRFNKLIRTVAPVPGAARVLRLLQKRSVPFAVATSGGAHQTAALLSRISGCPECPVITANDVAAAKPSPDLFEVAGEKIGKNPADCFVVGDSVWDSWLDQE
jgi:beta-phosphoglucomutase-like phosphatase (HAD superfamily)